MDGIDDINCYFVLKQYVVNFFIGQIGNHYKYKPALIP